MAIGDAIVPVVEKPVVQWKSSESPVKRAVVSLTVLSFCSPALYAALRCTFPFALSCLVPYTHPLPPLAQQGQVSWSTGYLFLLPCRSAVLLSTFSRSQFASACAIAWDNQAAAATSKHATATATHIIVLHLCFVSCRLCLWHWFDFSVANAKRFSPRTKRKL